MYSWNSTATRPVAIALAAILAAATAACGGPAAPPAETAKTASEATAPATDADAAAAEAAAAEAAAAEAAAAEEAAAAAAREQELKAKEVELQLRERELAAREAAAKAPAKSSSPPKTAAAPAPAPAAAAPPPPPVTVPAGTQVAVKLNSGYSTKTTALGTVVNAQLASDLVVNGRVVARGGAPISGQVTEVTSGSNKIGAVPALKIDFTQLVVADGTTMPVAIRIMQKGQSEKGRDTAKIVGGTAAGAIIGHQIDGSKGKVIGGVIGGTAGAIGAQKTGTEVDVAAGSVLSANVRTAFTYSGR